MSSTSSFSDAKLQTALSSGHLHAVSVPGWLVTLLKLGKNDIRLDCAVSDSDVTSASAKRTGKAYLKFAIGTRISYSKPLALKEISGFSIKATRITSLPKPSAAGGRTGGPPRSFQEKNNVASASTCQRTST